MKMNSIRLWLPRIFPDFFSSPSPPPINGLLEWTNNNCYYQIKSIIQTCKFRIVNIFKKTEFDGWKNNSRMCRTHIFPRGKSLVFRAIFHVSEIRGNHTTKYYIDGVTVFSFSRQFVFETKTFLPHARRIFFSVLSIIIIL